MAWSGGATPHAVHGAYELANVTVAFPHRREAALRGVSLSVRAGETLAVVGPSGAGKSTLLKLLNRLYDPDGGAVSLDGRDLRGLDLTWLRTRTGYVPQEPALFDLTVAENVQFGDGGGAADAPPPSEAAVAAALEAVGAAEFVDRLPDGGATRLGEGGRTLSGGQRQRLAVARALVRSPPILLWDEATSALDGASEALVHRALRAKGGNQTAVLVAHRLSSVLCADRVAVLREGRLEQLGTVEELRQQREGWFFQNFFAAREAAADEERH